MIMVGPKNLKSHHLLLLSAILVCSLWARCCRAQGNRSDPCETRGRCGPFGICNSQGLPTCTCLRGFEPLNVMEWNLGNWSSGCRRSVPLNCGGNNGTINGGKPDGFVKIDKVQIEGLSQRLPGDQNQCKDLCFANCSCLAYGFDPNVGCVGWGGDLMNIHYFSSGSGSNLYLRLANSELDQKKGSKIIIIIPVVIGFVILLSILAYFYWRRIAKRRRGKERTVELGRSEDFSPLDNSLDEALSQVNLEELPLYKFEILAIATHNFSDANKLGKGGFGTVYKGELGVGREVAVKRLSQASTQGMREFMNELVLISKLQHRNLVRLLGFCVENRETILIYEYMPNKSLDFYLFDPSKDILDWRKRFNIIEGICRGLLYLHRDSILKIIHRDLKPSNILLDNDWNPKISDFGMARIFGNQQDHVSTVRVVGTYGYMAPEYAKKGRFSEKSDVFSFGVLILEIATGRKNRSFYHQDGSLNLLGHVWKLWNEDNIADLIDPRISDPSYRPEVMRCIHIGLLCVQEFSIDRPSTSNVLSLLSSEIIELPEPKQPAFTIDSSRSDTGTNSSQLNNVSITMVDGR